MFSSTSIKPDSPNALAGALAAARDDGRPLIDLTVSNPTACGLSVDGREVLAALSAPGGLRYEPTPLGLLQAREAVARTFLLGVRPPPERILLTASTSEAYSFLFKLLCDPGDEVLVPEPGYPLLEHLARLERVSLRPYRLAYDGRWFVDLDSVGRALSDRTRAIVIVSPNNPTGNVISDAELGWLERLGVPIVSDEVFGSYAHTSGVDMCATALRSAASLTFVLGGLSKLCGLPQLKLAWLAVGGPPDVVAEAMERLELIADTYLSVASPVQHALSTILEVGARTGEAIRTRIRRNLHALRRSLEGSPCTVLHVEAGWYAVIRLPAVSTEDEWCSWLLADDGVIVQPGWYFDFSDVPLVVVSLLPSESEFDEGVRRLCQRVTAACR